MREELLERIRRYPYWVYAFDLGGFVTPIGHPSWANRHAQRKAYFFDPLVGLFGGSLATKRVLDLGCNAGFWSLWAIKSGAEYVVGIDARRTHIEQAELIFEASEVASDRYRFICGNVFDVLRTDIGSFDIVLCLGLLYHVSKPMDLLELISRVNIDVLVVDTALTGHRGPVLEIRHESLDNPGAAADYPLVTIPSRRAVMEMVRELGYRAVILRPVFTDYTGAEVYLLGRRRAFFCAKATDLSRLPAPIEPYVDARIGFGKRLRSMARAVLIPVLLAVNRLGRTARSLRPRPRPAPPQADGHGRSEPGSR